MKKLLKRRERSLKVLRMKEAEEFEKVVEGLDAKREGDKLRLRLGYSHDVVLQITERGGLAEEIKRWKKVVRRKK